jgi:hypothetical protein
MTMGSGMHTFGRAMAIGALGLALSGTAQPVSAQAQAPKVQSVQAPPELPVPEGFLDATAPGSPATEFFQLLQEEWRKRDFDPRALMAVWIDQGDLDRYYVQGVNPLEGHYCYVCFLPSEHPEQELEGLKASIGPADQAMSVRVDWMAKAFKARQAVMLGVLGSWDRGLVYGFLEPAAGLRSTSNVRRFYLKLTGIVTCRGGGYQLNDSCMVTDEPGIRQAAARLEALCRQVPVSR